MENPSIKDKKMSETQLCPRWQNANPDKVRIVPQTAGTGSAIVQ
jgi:hypothetical protein